APGEGLPDETLTEGAPVGSQAGDRAARSQAEYPAATDQAGGQAAGSQTQHLPAVHRPEDVPSLSPEEYLSAGSEDEVLAAAAQYEGPAVGGPWQRSLRQAWQRKVGQAWQRSVGQAWQGSVGRLGISRLWQPSPGVREAASPGARALALVTVMPVILLIAWLVPGVVLLLAPRLLRAPWLSPSRPRGAPPASVGPRAPPGGWRPLGTRGPAEREPGDPKPRTRPWAAWWGLGGTIAIAIVFAAWQLAESSAQFIVSRDPGAYAQFAYWIAEHGSLPIPTSGAAFGGTHPGLTFPSFAFPTH